jgi:uncharacterized membrane protein YeaQ/YmgE (transglycosylase-associated protein family)
LFDIFLGGEDMSILYWIVFGLIAGSVAEFIAPSAQGGIVGSIILGIIGAVVGGYLGQRFFGVGVTGFNVMSFVVAVAGALLVLFIGRLFAHV